MHVFSTIAFVSDNLHVMLIHGMTMNPCSLRWQWISNTSVNYAVHAVKGEDTESSSEKRQNQWRCFCQRKFHQRMLNCRLKMKQRRNDAWQKNFIVKLFPANIRRQISDRSHFHIYTYVCIALECSQLCKYIICNKMN